MGGRAVQVERAGVLAQQAGDEAGRGAGVAQQPRPRHASRLSLGRAGPEHLETAVAGIGRRRFRDQCLTRPRRAADDQRAAHAVAGAVQQAADLLHLLAPSRDKHTFGIPGRQGPGAGG